jgi:hypothetical protein
MQIVSWTWDSLSRGYRRSWSAERRPQFMLAVHARAGVFTARRFTGTLGWKRSGNVCRATDKMTRLHSRLPTLASSPHLSAKNYNIWCARCMDNLISLVFLGSLRFFSKYVLDMGSPDFPKLILLKLLVTN